MSRVGKSPVAVPKDVNVQITGNMVTVKGKLGELTSPAFREVKISLDADKVTVEPANDTQFSRAMWGTARNTIKNMIEGVSSGFTVTLEITGVGYRAASDATMLTMSLGFSHEIKYAIPKGISIKCDKNMVIVSGFDRNLVGQVASELMKFRPVEPYKGKGVYKKGSYIRRKEGKKK